MPKALFPELARHSFGDPPEGETALGWLSAAIPLGGFVFAVLSGWPHRFRHGVGVACEVLAWGVAVIGFGLADSPRLAVLFLLLGGGADLISMVYRSSMSQTAATDDMRGWSGVLLGTTTTIVGGGVHGVDRVVTARVLALPRADRINRVSPHPDDEAVNPNVCVATSDTVTPCSVCAD